MHGNVQTIVRGLATFPGKISQAGSIVSAVIRMNLAISLQDDGGQFSTR